MRFVRKVEIGIFYNRRVQIRKRTTQSVQSGVQRSYDAIPVLEILLCIRRGDKTCKVFGKESSQS